MPTGKFQWMIIACVLSIFAAKHANAEPSTRLTCEVFYKPITTNPVVKELFERLDGINAVHMCHFYGLFPDEFTIAKPIFTLANVIRHQTFDLGALPPPPFSNQVLARIRSKLQNGRMVNYVCIDPERCNKPFNGGFFQVDEDATRLSDAAYPFVQEIGFNIDTLLADYAKSLPSNKRREKRWAGQLKRGLKAKRVFFRHVTDDLVKGHGLVIDIDFMSASSSLWSVRFLTDGQNLRIANIERKQ
ncbi:MAG: hypothetical protein KAT26_09940 [Marinosulfonomonas sp.]|nr:hypothetical protein [Marinosulfonomonas sp.]